MARFTQDFYNMLPEGATHCTIEQREHRGQPVYALFAIIPNGANVCINGYPNFSMAFDAASAANTHLGYNGALHVIA